MFKDTQTRSYLFVVQQLCMYVYAYGTQGYNVETAISIKHNSESIIKMCTDLLGQCMF